MNVRRTVAAVPLADVNVRRTVAGPEWPGLPAGPLSELLLKANDHLMAAMRYALHTYCAQVRAGAAAVRRADDWLARWLGAKERRARDAADATDVV